MSFSYFSSPESYIKDEIDKRKGNILYASKLNPDSITSDVGNGMIITSNPNVPLFHMSTTYGIRYDYGNRSVTTEDENLKQQI